MNQPNRVLSDRPKIQWTDIAGNPTMTTAHVGLAKQDNNGEFVFKEKPKPNYDAAASACGTALF